MKQSPRILGEHFRADGQPKQAWPTLTEAHRAACAYGKTAYKCSFCGGFHIGGRVRKLAS